VLLFSDETINISKIKTIARYDYPQGKYSYNPKLNTYELVFFLSGESECLYNGKLHLNGPGSIRYMPKGVDASEYQVERTDEGVCIDIYFDSTDSLPEFAISMENVGELKNSFVKIYNIWSSKKTGYYVECMSVLYEIIRLLKKHNEHYFSTQQKDKLSAVYDYLLENYKNKDFDYKKLCEKSGLSYSYFKKLFISRFGESPVKYITRLRMEYAKELLITKRYSVSEIAEMCGFENTYYFSTVFKKSFGVSPTKYYM